MNTAIASHSGVRREYGQGLDLVYRLLAVCFCRTEVKIKLINYDTSHRVLAVVMVQNRLKPRFGNQLCASAEHNAAILLPLVTASLFKT